MNSVLKVEPAGLCGNMLTENCSSGKTLLFAGGFEHEAVRA